MSFKSLLYCPDDKTAAVVTQVLSELDFTVERAGEAFAAVKRLTDEHFDALVVDCHDEQDASLLFKAARNSAQNSSSLSVAVVEGQAGVAKAFRIGANLVLTKPINVEQSKSTLRVARGLLRKGQPKPAAVTAAPVAAAQAQIPQLSKTASDILTPVTPSPIQTVPPAPVAPVATLESRVTTPPPKAPVPFSGLVLEDEPIPETDAADAALLDSLPTISGKRPSEGAAPVLVSQTEPIAAGTSGQAAAAVRAPEKPALGVSTSAMPLVTNEPIVRDQALDLPEPEPVSPPSFSSLEHGTQGGGIGRLIKIVALIALVAGGGYFGFQKLRGPEYVRQFLQNRHAAAAEAQTASTPKLESEPRNSAVRSEAAQNQEAQNTAPQIENSSATDVDTAPTPPHVPRQNSAPIETINVKEMPASHDAGKVAEAPKPHPILVKSGTAKTQTSEPSVPPPVDVANLGSNENALPSIMAPAAKLPMPAPGTVRVSQGVSQGLLLKKVQPTYPAIAQNLHREGTVQLLATISKYGEISKVQVLSGDPMLSRAAVDAVKQWEYRPYLLNGQPVEIETQINIVFKARQ